MRNISTSRRSLREPIRDFKEPHASGYSIASEAAIRRVIPIRLLGPYGARVRLGHHPISRA